MKKPTPIRKDKETEKEKGYIYISKYVEEKFPIRKRKIFQLEKGK